MKEENDGGIEEIETKIDLVNEGLSWDPGALLGDV